MWTYDQIHWWVEWWEDRSSHWQCHWSRLIDRLTHQRDWLWARHCSRLTSCMWIYDQIHWWIERWERVDHCIENRCHWSRLTSCTWTDRRIDSLIDRVMRRSLHWWCHVIKADSLLIQIYYIVELVSFVDWLNQEINCCLSL